MAVLVGSCVGSDAVKMNPTSGLFSTMRMQGWSTVTVHPSPAVTVPASQKTISNKFVAVQKN